MNIPRSWLYLSAGLGLLLSSASTRAELIWAGQNEANADTLALYHFNSGSGTGAADAGFHGFDATLTRDFYAQEASGNWLGGGAGTYLSGSSGTPGDYVHTVSISGVDWNKGLTISLWYRVRDAAGSPNANNLFYLNGPGVVPRVYLSTDTFGTANNGRLNFTDTQGPGVDVSTGNVNYGANHVWRQLALVYDAGGNASDGGIWTFYLDNAQAGSVVNVAQDLSAVSAFDIRFMSGLFSTAGLSADMDEVLVQNGVITDFSNGFNAVPEPGVLGLVGLGFLLIRRYLLGQGTRTRTR